MFEDQGDSSEVALNEMLEHIWQDAVAISGIEMHRRVLSLAHNADFEEISDTKKRSQLEARNLMMGRELILNNDTIKDVSELTNMARKFNLENFL
jgi:5-methylthioribose kinase